MIIATEDSVSEAAVRRLISVIRPELQVRAVLGNRGKGYLKARARELNRTARSIPIFVLFDLDSLQPCPADVIANWLHGIPEANMLFRAAIMEVESWLLADRQMFSNFLGVSLNRIPSDTDCITNPKEFVVNLARRSRKRNIRDDLVPSSGSIVAVGPAYGLRLSEFLSAHWNPTRAASASRSLQRAIDRLRIAFVDR